MEIKHFSILVNLFDKVSPQLNIYLIIIKCHIIYNKVRDQQAQIKQATHKYSHCLQYSIHHGLIINLSTF